MHTTFSTHNVFISYSKIKILNHIQFHTKQLLGFVIPEDSVAE